MKKYQQWQQNQTYIHHLDRLFTIKNRKVLQNQVRGLKRGQSNGNLIELQSIQMQNRRIIQSIQKPKRQIEFKIIKEHKKQKSKLKKTLQQKFLAYENYLFGKRILQTSSVISKKQLDKQYKIHKRALKTMCKTRNQYHQQAASKLHQYINTSPSNFYSGQGSNYLTLKILNVQFYKHKLSENDFSDISLELHLDNHLICTEFVQVINFIGHEFSFRFKKKYVKENKIQVHIKYNKGNSDIQLCYFDIMIQQYLKNTSICYKVRENKQMYKRIGTIAGSIEYELSLQKKIKAII